MPANFHRRLRRLNFASDRFAIWRLRRQKASTLPSRAFGSRICLRPENLPPEKFSPFHLSSTPLDRTYIRIFIRVGRIYISWSHNPSAPREIPISLFGPNPTDPRRPFSWNPTGFYGLIPSKSWWKAVLTLCVSLSGCCLQQLLLQFLTGLEGGGEMIPPI